MKTRLKFLIATSLILSFVFTSCSKDGEVGPPGIAGINGTNGVDGVNGTDGIDGTAGVDGNANVTTMRFQSPEWSSSSSTSLGLLYLEVPHLTYDDINFSLILTYVSFRNQHYISPPVDNHFINGVGDGFSIDHIISQRRVQIRLTKTIFGPLPSPLPTVDYVKVIIIKPSEIINVTGNKAGKAASAQQNIYDQLKKAGANIGDYYAVCVHYGFEP